MRRGAAVWAEAVAGGAFYSRWSVALSFVVATFVSVPTLDDASPSGYLRAVVVAAVGWSVLAVLVAPAAFAERRLRTRAGRAVVVIGALLAAASLRTPLNDALGVWLWGISSEGAFGPRIVTNLVTALAVFSLVGVATSQYAQRHEIVMRLDDALAAMRSRLRLAERQIEQTDRMLPEAAARLRAARETMLAGTVDFDSVSRYSDEVRRESHDLEARADEAKDAQAPPAWVVHGVHVRTLGDRLAPTPWLAVALVYAVGVISFALMIASPSVVLLALLGFVAVDLLANAAVRGMLPKRPDRMRPVLFVGLWTAAGIAASTLTYTLVPGIGVLGLVPIITIPVIAVVLSLCVDALRSARAAERRSALLLARVARYVAESTARGIDPLRRASHVLHGRVQGRCVILAAHVDEHPATADQLALFREQTDEALDIVARGPREPGPVTGPVGEPLDAVTRMLVAWRAVMSIDLHASAEADEALAHAETAERAADAVNEALVNAVKHSSARTATVGISVVEHARVRVVVASRGRLLAAAQRVDGLGGRGRDVQISQRGEDVVLTALLPAATMAGARERDDVAAEAADAAALRR